MAFGSKLENTRQCFEGGQHTVFFPYHIDTLLQVVMSTSGIYGHLQSTLHFLRFCAAEFFFFQFASCIRLGVDTSSIPLLMEIFQVFDFSSDFLFVFFHFLQDWDLRFLAMRHEPPWVVFMRSPLLEP